MKVAVGGAGVKVAVGGAGVKVAVAGTGVGVSVGTGVGVSVGIGVLVGVGVMVGVGVQLGVDVNVGRGVLVGAGVAVGSAASRWDSLSERGQAHANPATSRIVPARRIAADLLVMTFVSSFLLKLLDGDYYTTRGGVSPKAWSIREFRHIV